MKTKYHLSSSAYSADGVSTSLEREPLGVGHSTLSSPRTRRRRQKSKDVCAKRMSGFAGK
jgi:hypothetical protein